MANLSKFVKEVIATIKGDDAQTLALKIERKAQSAFKQQIASLEAAIVDQEEAVASALEKYNQAVYPSTQIEDSKKYIQSIADAKHRLDKEQEQLEQLQDSLDFFSTLQKEAF